VFPAGSWYLCNQLHLAFVAARTKSDVDASDLQHHFLEGVGYFEQLGGQFEQPADKGQIGCSVAISQKAIVSDSDKALR
jgi:hypothetical protein